MKVSCLFALAAILSLSSCDRVKEAAGRSADAALERAKEDIKSQIEDSELAKTGREYADKAKAVMGKLDIDKLKGEVEQVNTAIASGDYAAAEKFSGSVDKILGSRTVGDTVELMRIRTEQGAEAAQRKLSELRSLPDLAPKQKEFWEKIGSRISNFDAKDRESVTQLLMVGVIVGAGSELGHGAEIGLFVADKLFPGGKAGELMKEMKIEPEK